MNSSKLQKIIFAALTESTKLPVTKYAAKYNGSYPVIVYQEIANKPALYGDNKELATRYSYQISIGTEDDDYEDLETKIEETMLNLGFSRIDATDIFDGVYWRILRFIILKEK